MDFGPQKSIFWKIPLKQQNPKSLALKEFDTIVHTFAQPGQGRKSSFGFIISLVYVECVQMCSHVYRMSEDSSVNFQD